MEVSSSNITDQNNQELNYEGNAESDADEVNNFSEDDRDIDNQDNEEGEYYEEHEEGQEGEDEGELGAEYAYENQDYEGEEDSANFSEENFSVKHSSKRNSQIEMQQRSSLMENEGDVAETLNLNPERKIRYKLYRFLNKLREQYLLPEFMQDSLGNKVAMLYAEHLLTEKDNESILLEYANKLHYNVGSFKYSFFSVFNDLTDDNGKKKSQYSDYVSEFVDAHSTLVEFEEHRNNILSQEFNTVSIGMAYDDEKVVVVDLFSTCDLTIESCNINEDMGSIIVKGRMLNDNFGVYALRIVSADTMHKSLMLLNPSNIISPEQKQRPFTASFIGAQALIKDKSLKYVEVYIRGSPGSIKYNQPFAESMAKFESDLKYLKFAVRFELETFPLDYVLKEHKKEEDEEKRRHLEHETKLREEKIKEKEEKENRIKKMDNNNNLGLNKNFYKIGEVPEELEEDRMDANKSRITGDGENSMNKTNKTSEENMSMMSESQSDEVNRKENYQKQLDKLEQNIDELKRENDDLQKKIKIIFEFRKKEGREEKNYYKDSNINESIYADSLTSAANLHNELNTHKRKLMADLEKYNQSIEIQDERKREVYKILMNYKEELLFNAEYRKGTKIPRDQVDRWLEKEKEAEDHIRSLRIDNIKYTLELNRLNKELKKMEEYFEGLHLIDFEQLKIENNTLTEKIEDRNEEIHKLESKIHNNVQILAHLQQKYAFVHDEFVLRENKVKEMTNVLSSKKNILNDKKKNIEHNNMTKLQTKVKIDQINSKSLKNYYSSTNTNIENLCMKIDLAIAELSKYRKQDNLKDIKLLETRKMKLLEEYKLLPKI